MANKSLFASAIARLLPAADTLNHEAAPSYAYGPEALLAQLAATGTLSDNFYSSAEAQLSKVLEAARGVDALFVAKAAIYARQSGAMKDMPALLAAFLTVVDPALAVRVFARVVDNGRMLRSFVQIMRSGQIGRSSLGTRPKRLVQQWLEKASMRDLMAVATGNDPSLKDIVRMVHPKPADAARQAFYAWVLERPYDVAALPAEIAAFEAWKREPSGPLPPVPFEWLTSFSLTPAQWGELAGRICWQALRMNLNTLARNGAFTVDGVADLVAARLSDADAVGRARVLPYHLMMSPNAAGNGVPLKVNAEHAKVDLVVIVSDNQSWVDATRGGATQTMREWDQLTRRNRGAKLVCIDLQPHGTSQASGRPDILNVGGFSDAVFDTIARFARGDTQDWVELVKQTEV